MSPGDGFCVTEVALGLPGNQFTKFSLWEVTKTFLQLIKVLRQIMTNLSLINH